MLYFFCFVSGLIIGRILNICIERLPNRQPIAIPLRKPAVELLTGLLFMLCLTAMGFSEHLFNSLIFTCFLIVIAFIDYDHSLIFDKVLIPMAVIGATFNLLIGDIKTLNMLFSALVGGGVFLLLALISRGGFGGGDIKFMACISLWLGFKYTVLALFLTFILGGLGSAFLMALRMKGRKDYIPYGPYMALAAFIAILYGEIILEWYLR